MKSPWTVFIRIRAYIYRDFIDKNNKTRVCADSDVASIIIQFLTHEMALQCTKSHKIRIERPCEHNSCVSVSARRNHAMQAQKYEEIRR